MTLTLLSVPAGMTVQDLGRRGGMGFGLSRGGAMDRLAFLDGLALLDNPLDTAGFEMAGRGGTLRFDAPARIALTGARMRATLDGAEVPHLATVSVTSGQVLTVGGAQSGMYGYLHVAGGLDTPIELGGRGHHGIAALGPKLAQGQTLRLGTDPNPNMPEQILPPPPTRTEPLRVMPGPQTDMFPDTVMETFEATTFRRSVTGNRQGVRLDHDGAPFSTGEQLTLVSDFICEGDIQLTGEGTPYVLMADCQTMGGYPRLGTVLPHDLPQIAQAAPGTPLRFQFVTEEQAQSAYTSDQDLLRQRRAMRQAMVRDPSQMDLLSYDLIDRPPPDIIG